MNRMTEMNKSKIHVLMRADLIAAGINPDKYLKPYERKQDPRMHGRPKPPQTRWMCMICHREYIYRGALINHIKKYHPENIEGFPE